MELTKHIGLRSKKDLNVISFLLWLRALFVFFILLNFLIYYHFFAIICNILVFILPESTNNFKRLAYSMFWELCFYLIELNNVKIIIQGEEIESESAVIICNHQSLADYIVIAYLAKYSSKVECGKLVNNSLTLPRVNFFSWFTLWRLPNLKVLLNILKCDENWELEKGLSFCLFEKVITSKIPEWIVIFPEVNIWTEEGANLQGRQSEKYYLPNLRHTLYPRFSAFYNAISSIRIFNNYKFTKLYDLSIYYEVQNKSDKETILPSLIDIFANEYPITINVDIKSKSLVRVPAKRHKLEKWLEKVWCEKDKHLHAKYLDTKNTHIDY